MLINSHPIKDLPNRSACCESEALDALGLSMGGPNNPRSYIRAELVDGEWQSCSYYDIAGKEMAHYLTEKRAFAWAVHKATADDIVADLGAGWSLVESNAVGISGGKLYVVTDGTRYVA